MPSMHTRVTATWLPGRFYTLRFLPVHLAPPPSPLCLQPAINLGHGRLVCNTWSPHPPVINMFNSSSQPSPDCLVSLATCFFAVSYLMCSSPPSASETPCQLICSALSSKPVWKTTISHYSWSSSSQVLPPLINPPPRLRRTPTSEPPKQLMLW